MSAEELAGESSGVRPVPAGRPNFAVTLLTAHKILISSAVLLFLVYAGWELRHYAAGDASALLRSALSALAAMGLAVYLRWVWIHRPGDRSPG
jgi:hypothetical protein